MPRPVLGQNLPFPTSSLVGRQDELAALRERLAANRLVTLLGAGGCGKTRLALELGRECQRLFPDGVWLVDVSPLDDDALLTQVVGSTLEVPEEAGRDRLDTVLRRLEPAQVLILFDNCEHLRGPCALLAHALLSRCPRLKVLATSREPLNLPGESIFRVPPLARGEAVELFAERAREAGALDEGPPDIVEAVCRRLDRMPLAIELAAAHARAMTGQEILRRLDDRFQLLRGGSQVAPARQQTLRATIAWSYGLLSQAERTLSDRLAIFAGGCTAEAAEEVCADGELPSVEVAGLIEQLVDKSLLVPEVGAEGQTRYWQLETVRAHARERLPSQAETAALARRHALHYADLAERTGPALMRSGARSWLNSLAAESDNLRAALDWCHEHEPGRELRAAAALVLFWMWRDAAAEGRRRLAGVLRNFPDPTVDRAMALTAGARLASRTVDYEAATAALQEALEIQRRMGTVEEVAWAQRELGLTLTFATRFEEARPLLQEAMAAARATGRQPMIAAGLLGIGLVTAATDMAAARDLLVECVAARRRLSRCPSGFEGPTAAATAERSSLGPAVGPRGASRGDRAEDAWALAALGGISASLGELDQAGRALDEALVIAAEVEDRGMVGGTLACAAAVAAQRGMGRRASVLKGAAYRLWGPSGTTNLPPWLEQSYAGIEATDPGVLVSDLDRLVAFATGRQGGAEAGRPKAGPVSAREAEVAMLVTEGLSNRDIGRALHLSERTVETHVQHILNKLGFHSRSQIAAWVGQQ
ncbi:MAG: LuxR C-terminal-related transcriptional regulator [bacterium]|nr:LuxR C-terminal-related transcriptional regulator [bacterium]